MKQQQTKIATEFKLSVRRPIAWNFVRNSEAKAIIVTKDNRELPIAA